MQRCKNCGKTNSIYGGKCIYCGYQLDDIQNTHGEVSPDGGGSSHWINLMGAGTSGGSSGHSSPKKAWIWILAAVLALSAIVTGIFFFSREEVSGSEGIIEHYNKWSRTISYTGDFPAGSLFMRIPKLEEISTGKDSNNNSFQYVNQELVVLSAPGISFSQMEELMDQYGLKITGYIADCDTYQVRSRSKVTLEELNAIAEKLSEETDVSYASLNLVTDVEMNSYALPNDPWDGERVSGSRTGGSNWGVEAIRAPWFWENYNLRGVHVGVIDSMFATHQDLRYAGIFKNNYQYSSKSSHGTHVSGTIGATYSNGIGLSGVLKDPLLYVTDYNSKIDYSQNNLCNSVLRIDLMVKSGARVMNCSFGYKTSSYNSAEERRAIAVMEANAITPLLKRLLTNGHDFVIVNSAGNDGRDSRFSDAEYNYWLTAITDSEIRGRIVAVGAAKLQDGNFRIADFSSRGSRVDVMAPGENIYSCVDSSSSYSNRYGYMNGTSMAAPHVTAVCAALWEYYPALSGADIKTLLVRTANLPVIGTPVKMINMWSAFGGYTENAIQNHKTIDLQTLLSYNGYGGAGTSTVKKPTPTTRPVSTPAPGQITTPAPTSDPVWGSWSSWQDTPIYSSNTRQVETRTVASGYNMVHYGTQTESSPHYRMFRNYSIGGNYDAYGARRSYGEKHYTRYVSASMLDYAVRFEPGVLIRNSDVMDSYGGYQKGTDTAYYFGDDKYVWFIESTYYTTQYRYRDMY